MFGYLQAVEHGAKLDGAAVGGGGAALGAASRLFLRKEEGGASRQETGAGCIRFETLPWGQPRGQAPPESERGQVARPCDQAVAPLRSPVERAMLPRTADRWFRETQGHVLGGTPNSGTVNGHGE